MSERAVACIDPPQNGDTLVPVVFAPEIDGSGLEYEIARMKYECLSLGRLLARAIVISDLDTIQSVSRTLDSKRDALRAMTRDTPKIHRAEKNAIGRENVEAAFLRYVTEVSAKVSQLAPRILSILPAELAAATGDQIRREIDAVRESAAVIRLDLA